MNKEHTEDKDNKKNPNTKEEQDKQTKCETNEKEEKPNKNKQHEHGHKKSKKEKLAELEEQKEKLQNELEEQKNKNLRLMADFDNYRKRVYKDIETSRILAQIDTLCPFLQIYDVFNMAVKASESSDNIESLRQGLDMILKEFKKTLDELNVTEIDATGQKFNPDLHEAVDKKETDEYEEGVVVQQWRKGYKLGDRVIRPANVVVSVKPENKQDNTEESKNKNK